MPEADSQLVEGIDYYWEGPYMVFTAEYHLKRGYCCHSGCRHCPYDPPTATTEQPGSE
jgi:hypothetical protein